MGPRGYSSRLFGLWFLTHLLLHRFRALAHRTFWNWKSSAIDHLPQSVRTQSILRVTQAETRSTPVLQQLVLGVSLLYFWLIVRFCLSPLSTICTGTYSNPSVPCHEYLFFTHWNFHWPTNQVVCHIPNIYYCIWSCYDLYTVYTSSIYRISTVWES